MPAGLGMPHTVFYMGRPHRELKRSNAPNFPVVRRNDSPATALFDKVSEDIQDRGIA